MAASRSHARCEVPESPLRAVCNKSATSLHYPESKRKNEEKKECKDERSGV
jgi:hypothetical protein